MAAVLLTRPAAAAEDLAARLGALGYATLIEPLLYLFPTHESAPDSAGIDAVMITSGNALAALTPDQAELAPLLLRPCFCVGSRTAIMARSFGFRHVIDADGDGKKLAAAIRHETKRPSAILHIAGSHINATAHGLLREAGLSVSVWPVYRAEVATALSPATVERLQQGRIDYVPVFSARTASTLTTLLLQYKLESACRGMTALAISDNVADALRALPWQTLAVAPAPTEDSVLTLLQA